MTENEDKQPARGTRKPKPRVQGVAALVRDEESILLVREPLGSTGEFGWSLPGGGVEIGELLHEAAAREVVEETGLRVGPPVALAFVVHHDTEAYPSAMMCGLEYREWSGRLDVGADPSGDVAEAAFFPIEKAIELMTATTEPPHYEPTVEYLRGNAPAGTAWLYRRLPGGTDELVRRVPDKSS